LGYIYIKPTYPVKYEAKTHHIMPDYLGLSIEEKELLSMGKGPIEK